MNKIFLFCLIIIIFAFGLATKVRSDVESPGTQGTVQIEEEEEETPTPTGGGGMPSAWFMPPKAPEDGFQILINNGAEYTDTQVVILSLNGGPDTKRMAISNFSDFRDAGQKIYQSSKSWNLCQGLASCPKGKYTVYAKFFTDWGTASEVVSDSIIYKEKPTIEFILKQIKSKLDEIAKVIDNLKSRIVGLFQKKEATAETPKIRPEESRSEKIAPPAEGVATEKEIVSPPEKQKPTNFLKKFGNWVWQKIMNFWQKILPR